MTLPTYSLTPCPAIVGHQAAIYALASAYTATYAFFSADGSGWIVGWPPYVPTTEATGKVIARVPAHVFGLSTHPEFPERLLAGSMQGVLYALNLTTAEVIAALKLPPPVFAICQTPKYVYIGTGNGTIALLQPETLKWVTSLPVAQSAIRCLCHHPYLPLLAVGSSDHHIYIIHTAENRCIQTLHFHQNSVFSLAFSPDGNTLISGSRDAHLAYWQYNAINTAYELTHTLPAHWFTINSIVHHPSFPIFATGSRDKSIRIWHTPTATLLKVIDASKPELEPHRHSVNSLLWHNNLLLSASDDRRIGVWQIESVQP